MTKQPHGRGRTLRTVIRRGSAGFAAALLLVAVPALVCAGATVAAPSAQLSAPTTGILDNFNGRGAEDPLDQWGNWAPVSIDGQGQTFELVSGGAGHQDGSPADSYRVQTITGDAEVYATMVGVPPNDDPMFLYLHLRDLGGAGWDGYRLRLVRRVSTVVDFVAIDRISDGIGTQVAIAGVPGDLQGGDGFLLRQTGSTLTVSHGRAGVWTQLLSAPGGEYQSGSLGIGSNPGGLRWDDFGGTGETTPEPPPPTLPGTDVLDRFDRLDEDPLSQGNAWAPSPISGTGQTLEVLGGMAGHNEGDFVPGDSYRPTDISGDAAVFATLSDVPENNDPMYLFLHLQQVGGAGWDGYKAHLERTITADALHIQKVTDGAATTLVTSSVELAGGDVYVLRRVGIGLALWRQNAGIWTKLMSTSDPDYTHGFLGLGVADHSSRWDDFGGGAIGAPPPPATRLTVVKTVVNDNGGTATSSNWMMNVAGPTPLSFTGADSPGTTNDVQPGAYTVTESGGPAGYTLSYGGQCDATGNVSIAAGETKTCTLTNNDVVPSGGPPGPQTFGAGENIHARCGCTAFADPVNSRTGAFTTAVDDLDLPGTGVSFAWSRSYTSADTTVGRFGPGWTDSYSTSLAVQPSGDVRLHGEDGQQVYYTRQGDGSFVGAPGSLSTLASVAGGYELLRTDQVKYRFDTQGRLLSVKDRNDQGVTLAYDASNRLTSVTDAASRQATISYNAQDLVSQVQTPDGRSVGYGYTGGRLTSVTDVRGKTWTYTYDAGGRLEKMIDPLNHAQVTNVYGADGRVQSQTDALNKVTTFTWNASTETATATDANQKLWTHDYAQGVLVEEVDPLQNDTDLVLDSDLNTTAVTGPTNETTQMTYDAAGNLLSATAPPSLGSAQKTFVYNARNDVELVTDARGKVTDYVYNPAGNLVSVTQDGVGVGSYTYDAAGRVETFTDGNEKTWTYSYFPTTGYLASATDPLGNKTTYTYDGAGRVSTRVDPKGNVQGCNCAADFTWTYTYNPAGQLLTEQNPLGHTTTNVYDDAGRLTSTTDALGRTTSYTYDHADRVLTETSPDPDGAGPLAAPVTTSTYDSIGNKLTETDPRGNTTTFACDDANRLVSTMAPDPDGAGPLSAPVTTQAYDPNGNLASTVEPRGNVSGATPDEYRTTFTYDAAGRLLTETQPDPDGAGPQTSPVTTNDYDSVGNLQSVRDGNNHTTSYTYDAAGRILTVTAPDLGVTTYTYDDAGNLLTRRDDNQHTTTFAYDNAGRLVSETSPDPDGPGPQGPAVTSHTYDPNGNRLTVTDPNGNATQTAGDGVTTYGYDRANRQTSIDYSDSTPDVSFTYDAVGNQLSMTDGQGTETRTYDALDRPVTVTRGQSTFSYAYDAASNVTRRTYPGVTGVDYTYDPLNRLAAVVDGSNTTSYAYDPASNLTQTTLPSGNGYVESRVYDRAGRLTEVKHQRGTSVLSHFVSALDPVGNPTQVVRTGSLAETQTYTYDANDRITGVCFQAGTCPGASDPFIRWAYDKVGNRLSEQRPNGVTTAYTYDARDRLLSAGSTSFAYDQNGNQTQKGTRTFAYDLANRLKTTTQSSTTTTYLYDGEGKRVEATGEGTTAAPTLRSPCSTATDSSGTATVNKPTGTVAGDLLIVGLSFEKGSDVAITPPSGWTLIRRTNQSTDVGNATYRKTAGASEPASYAFALTNTPKWSIGGCAIAGADGATPIDVHNGATGESGNPSAPSVTTTGPSRLLLAFYANKKAATFSGYTSPAVERFDAPNGPGGLPSNAMASYEQTAAGATGAKSAVASEQEKWVAQQIAIAPAPGAGVTRFLWDVNQGLPQLALERDGNNSPLRSYTYGARRISQSAGTDISYFHYDPLGSVSNVTSSAGATQWTYAYEPFGMLRSESSTNGPSNSLKFTGEYLDPTGLYHLRARQYDPTIGRMLSRDPISAALSQPLASSFAYVNSRPLVLVDPSGLVFQFSDPAQLRSYDATARESFAGPGVLRDCADQDSTVAYAFSDPLDVESPLTPTAGCGPGSIGDRLIPDWVFRPACDFHDRCYGGRRPWYRTSRSKCDSLFRTKMRVACKDEYGGLFEGLQKDFCYDVAEGYYKAVRRGGEGGYFSGHRDECLRRKDGNRRQCESWARRMARS